MGVGIQRQTPAVFPRERPGIHCVEGWVGLMTGVDGCGRFRLSPGFDPRTVQLPMSRYTNCTIPARIVYRYVLNSNALLHLFTNTKLH